MMRHFLKRLPILSAILFPGVSAWRVLMRALRDAAATFRNLGARHCLRRFPEIGELTQERLNRSLTELSELDTVHFIQVGSNDGRFGDPIYEFAANRTNWTGILIEPVKHLYDELRRNYPNVERLEFLNLAISADDGTMPFFFVDPKAESDYPDLPSWHQAIGGFRKDHIVAHLGEQILPFICEIRIPTATVATLLKQHPKERLDLLHIDTEGFDFAIFNQFHALRVHPKVVLLEYCHLTYWEAFRLFLKLRKRYILYKNDCDILACRKDEA